MEALQRTTLNTTNVMSEDHRTTMEPFAKIDSVASNSPAQEAGLQVNDYILQFGTITTSSTSTMQDVAQLVPQAAGQQTSITIVVQRQRQNNDDDMNNEIKTIQLTPRPWNGRGLLGCHIVPWSSSSSN